jgi:YfiH family protein
MGRRVESIFDVWQVHSAEVTCTDLPRPLDEPHRKSDAILTANPEITLFMRFADCVPILLHEPGKKVVGIVHAGWQGTVKKIVQNAVERMTVIYGSNPADIKAGIGPSIGPDHYEIGPEVIEKVKDTFGSRSDLVLIAEQSKTHLDLWRSNSILLEDAGVHSIEIAGICTACYLDRWYSHRAEHGLTGRFGAFLALTTDI